MLLPRTAEAFPDSMINKLFFNFDIRVLHNKGNLCDFFNHVNSVVEPYDVLSLRPLKSIWRAMQGHAI
jgi:hypothetical protein